MEILDQPVIEANKATVKYAGFWKRLAAVLIDKIIIAPISFGLAYFSLIDGKKYPMLFIAIMLLGIAYKPVMEYMFGAAVGKAMLKLKVVTRDLEAAGAVNILLRNAFDIVPSLVSLFLMLQIYTDQEITSLPGFTEYSNFETRYKALQIITPLSGLITFIDGIVLMVDQKSRSLHDKIGGTSVIYQP